MKIAARTKDRKRILNKIFFLALLIFILIAVCVHIYPENRFDKYIQEQTSTMGSRALLPFWIRISIFGSVGFLFPAWVIFILICIWKYNLRLGLSVAGLAVGSFLLVQILKLIIHRYRPPAPLIPNFVNYGFPSGHSTSSFIFCAILIYSLWHSSVPRALRFSGMIFLILLICCVGMSRIVLNVHYPTDVAAGFSLGTLWVIGWYRYIHNKISDQ